MATFNQSRSMPGRMKGKGTQELFSELARGRRQGKRLSTQLGIVHCHHASYNYHTQKILPGKTKDTVALDHNLLQLDISDTGQGIGMDQSTDHSIGKLTNRPAIRIQLGLANSLA